MSTSGQTWLTGPLPGPGTVLRLAVVEPVLQMRRHPYVRERPQCRFLDTGAGGGDAQRYCERDNLDVENKWSRRLFVLGRTTRKHLSESGDRVVVPTRAIKKVRVAIEGRV